MIRKRESFIQTPKDWKKFQLNNKSVALKIFFEAFNIKKTDLHTN